MAGRCRSPSLQPARDQQKKTIKTVYKGGVISADRYFSVEGRRRLQRAWSFFRPYTMESCYRPGVRLPPKGGMLKAKVSKTLLYGGVRIMEPEQG